MTGREKMFMDIHERFMKLYRTLLLPTFTIAYEIEISDTTLEKFIYKEGNCTTLVLFKIEKWILKEEQKKRDIEEKGCQES